MLPFQTDKKPQNIILHNSNSRCSKHMVTDIHAIAWEVLYKASACF